LSPFVPDVSSGQWAHVGGIGLTAPPTGEGPGPRGYDLHMYAAAAVFFAGLAALPLVFWLVDRRERGPRQLRWRLLVLAGALAGVAIGAIGMDVAVHAPYAANPRPEGTLAEFAAVALVVFLGACAAANRAMPRDRLARATTGSDPDVARQV
jgi:MFS family permease